MGRYTGPKDRLSRREGFDLFGKGAKLTRLTIKPGMHGQKIERGNKSQYGRQLREKQKVKRMYGVMEKQFRNYMDKAFSTKGNTVELLFSYLESRLDNVVFRLGFTQTRPQSRQLVGHRHVLVNGKKLNIASYQVKPGDTITLTPKAMAIPSVKQRLEEKDVVIPEYLKRKGPVGKMESIPTRDSVKEPIADQDIIEFYSR